MRGWWMISVLALAGCGGEHAGFNPNYQFGSGDYGRYLAAREGALVTNTDSPQVIPVVLPALSPTPEQIAGRAPVPIPATMGVKLTPRTVVATPAQGTVTQAPVTQPMTRNDPTAPIQIVPRSMQPLAGRVVTDPVAPY